MNTNTAPIAKKITKIMDVPGLLECTFNHTIASSDATFKWTGPKIPREEWNKVLAFFRWTYNEHKSESQVKMFVNHVTKEWKAWAFPQRAKTGMTAVEIPATLNDSEEIKEQRRQFKESEGWTYFGTVHHHCSSSAFQSGTDEHNERDQDGLHITVGKIDEDQFDIHHRTYIGGFKMLMVKLTDFWDVEPEIASLPQNIQKMLKSNVELLAMGQMGTPPPAGCEFPQQWRDNVIEEVVIPRVVTGFGGHEHWSDSNYSGPQRKFYRNRVGVVYDVDKKKAVRWLKAFILSMPKETKCNLEDCVMKLAGVMQVLEDDDLELLDIMLQCDISFETLALAVQEHLDDEKKREELARNSAPETGKRGNGRKHKPAGSLPASNQEQIEQLREELREQQQLEGEGWSHYGV